MTAPQDRTDLAIQAAADALLSVCALQTGTDPFAALDRAVRALEDTWQQAAAEHGRPDQRHVTRRRI